MSTVLDAEIVDHSTLAQYVECPLRARMVQDGIIIERSDDLLVGQEIHDCLSHVTREYVKFGKVLTNTELADWLREELNHIRPDLQPQCLEAMKPTVWSWSNWIWEQTPEAIMRHDGGEGDRSGQLSTMIESVIVTSELDLLLATPSPEVVRVVDYKTGWKPWDEDDVSRSLQFQLHAYLVFQNYPDVQAVDVQVYMTRLNKLTSRVRFDRRKEREIEARLMESVRVFQTNRQVPLREVAAHPKSHCTYCPAVLLCDVGSRSCGVNRSPEEMLSQLVQLAAHSERITEILSRHVEESGRDVIVNGHAFGTGKPKSTRKPTKSLYEVE